MHTKNNSRIFGKLHVVVSVEKILAEFGSEVPRRVYGRKERSLNIE
jgi:hypothetical protein